MKLEEGVFLAIEGIDGAGKTTQARVVAERLRSVGLAVVTSKEPTNGDWGRKIRESAETGRMAPDEELEAFLKDREEHVDNVIRPSLDRGEVVIVDRYFYSNAAYQGVRGLDPEDILDRNAVFAPTPDLVVVLDVAPEVGLARVRERGDKANTFEQLELLEASRSVFRTLTGDHIAFVDGTMPVEVVTRTILRGLVQGPLFRRLCGKPYLEECEPEFCSVRIAGACEYPDLGPLGAASDADHVDVSLFRALSSLAED